MELYVVRHGLAGKPDAKKFPDDDLRPLTGKGRKEFAKAARGLKRLKARPEKILMSPAFRTRETAAILAEELGVPRKALIPLDELHHQSPPSAAIKKLTALLKSEKAKSRGKSAFPKAVALVGHQPWLGEFVSLLIAGNFQAQVELSKGGAALIELDSGVKPAGGVLAWCLTQDQLIGFEAR